MWIVYAVAGLIVGCVITSIYNKHKTAYLHVGTIKLHHDEDGSQYMFLEVVEGGMSKIKTEKQVILDVDLNNYITQ